MADVVVSLDLGTSVIKALALDGGGGTVAKAVLPMAMLHPVAEAAVQDAEALWAIAVRVVRRVAADLQGNRVRAVALSGAMHSLLALGDGGEPVGYATTWADQRASAIERGNADGLYQATGCPLLPLYHPARLRWMQEHEGDVFEAAACFAGLKDYIFMKLTGVLATDVNLAATTGLVGLGTGRYDVGAMAVAGVEEAKLPRILPVRHIGALSRSGAEATGLAEGLPVVLGGSDGAMANIGSGTAGPGGMAMTKGSGVTVITVGTSAAVRALVGEPVLDEGGRSWCYRFDERVYLAGMAMSNAGTAVERLRMEAYGEYGEDEGYAHLFGDASRVEAGCGGKVLLPFYLKERGTPWPSKLEARGGKMETGMSQAGRARATLEGVSFAVAGMVGLFRRLEGIGEAKLRLTGRIVHQRMWAQMLCDILGEAVEMVDVPDASAVGAGVAGWEAIGEMGHGSKMMVKPPVVRLEPREDTERAYREARGRFSEAVRAQGVEWA